MRVKFIYFNNEWHQVFSNEIKIIEVPNDIAKCIKTYYDSDIVLSKHNNTLENYKNKTVYTWKTY